MEKISKKKKLGIGLSSVGLIGALGGTYEIVEMADTRYALADQHHRLVIRVTINETTDLYQQALENLYFYRKQLRKYPDDLDIQDKVKQAEKQVETLQKQLLELKKEQKVES